MLSIHVKSEYYVHNRNALFLINMVSNPSIVLLDFSLSVKAAPYECKIRTGQP